MKKVSVSLAITATLLLALSLLLQTAALLLRIGAWQRILEYAWPTILGTASTILINVIRLGFAGSTIFLVGRKKGGVWIDIVLFLILLVGIPFLGTLNNMFWMILTPIVSHNASYNPIDSFLYPSYISSLIDVFDAWVTPTAIWGQMMACFVCGISFAVRKQDLENAQKQ